MDFREYSNMVREWIQKVLDNRGINAELMIENCKKIEQYAVENGDTKLIGFSSYYMGETYYVLNDAESLFNYMTRALSCLDSTGQWELVARAYNIMAITSSNRGNAPIAMDYYLTGLNYCKKYQLELVEMIINFNIGNLYMNCGQYKEAQTYIEKAYQYIFDKMPDDQFGAYLISIYVNLGKCYMKRGLLDKAYRYVERMENECGKYLLGEELLEVNCLKAQLFQKMGRTAQRDACIHYIHENIKKQMTIMDLFDDLYEYCELLLEIDKDKEFWNITGILESLAMQAKLVNLQRRMISLKIRYYRKNNQNEEYLTAAGQYYTMTEVLEKENQYMVINMLNVRSSLERANERRRQMEQENELLLKKSETDPLTGIANRFRLNQVADEAFQKAFTDGSSLAMEILDVDYFKQYNDNYGHQEGDNCIIAIAEELRKLQNEQIFCARYGGDEFVVIYQGMSLEEVFEKSKELRGNIMERKIAHEYSKTLPIVTISQGICWAVPRNENKSWDYLHVADTMLYQVKRKKRNGICVGTIGATDVLRMEC